MYNKYSAQKTVKTYVPHNRGPRSPHVPSTDNKERNSVLKIEGKNDME